MAVHVPGRLPLGELVRDVERTDTREVNARRKIRLREQQPVAASRVVASEFEIDGERHPARENESARDRGFLLADDGGRAAPRGLALGGIEKCPENAADRLPTRGAAAEHDDTVGRERPTGIPGLDAQVQAGELGIAARQIPIGELDLVRVRHAGGKYLVLQTQARQRVIVRDSDGRHGRCLRADQHGAVGHGRPPVITEAQIELCPVKAEADQRPGRPLPSLVSHTAHIHQSVGARLDVRRTRHLKGTLRRFAVLVGHHGLRAVGDRARDAGELNRRVLHVLLESSADATAQNRIDLTGFRQCIQYHRRRDRSGHDRLATQNEDALHLAFNLGVQIERQIGGYAACVRVRLQCGQQRKQQQSSSCRHEWRQVRPMQRRCLPAERLRKKTATLATATGLSSWSWSLPWTRQVAS